MSGWLALVGGGEWNEGCTFDADLWHASGKAEIVVLPTAAAYEHPDRAVAHAGAWFATFGATVRPLMVLARRDAEQAENAAIVADAKFVYLSGGSPLHLRSVLKDSPVWDALVTAWNRGAVVAGSSAGAMVLGDPMVDPRGGAFTLGLGLLPRLSVLAHANTLSLDKLRRTLKMADTDIVVAAIDERTALLRSPDGHWSTAGVGRVTAHKGSDDLALDQLAAGLA